MGEATTEGDRLTSGHFSTGASSQSRWPSRPGGAWSVAGEQVGAAPSRQSPATRPQGKGRGREGEGEGRGRGREGEGKSSPTQASGSLPANRTHSNRGDAGPRASQVWAP